MKKETIIGLIGLGYVGLPLSLELGKYFKTISYDSSKSRVKNINKQIDTNKEIKKNEFLGSKLNFFTNKIGDLNECNFYIFCLPTPVNSRNIPDLRILKNAISSVSKLLKDDDIIVFESTLYPGCVEEVLVPLIEKNSKKKLNINFSVGYSPERINPGDKTHTIKTITKIISASNDRALKIIKNVYQTIIKIGGIHICSSIKVAESAKVIENIQRDVNIALINELSALFDKLDINTYEVIKAASTKWNFLKFYPGLVGGHCIGVDPYYLLHKSREIGFNSKLITCGRNINNNVPTLIVKKIHSELKKRKIKNDKILIMGLTYKENCTDIRNSKVFDIARLLNNKKYKVELFDPNVKLSNSKLKIINKLPKNKYSSILIAVSHSQFFKIGLSKIKKSLILDGFIYDYKNLFKTNSEII